MFHFVVVSRHGAVRRSRKQRSTRHSADAMDHGFVPACVPKILRSGCRPVDSLQGYWGQAPGHGWRVDGQ